MGITYNSSVVRNGLVLHLDAANVKSYPGSGTVWNDLSGNGNNGTLTSVGYTTDDKGSLIFDNSADTCVVSHNSSLNFSSVFTVSTWIKVNSFSTSVIYNVVSKKPSFNSTQKGWSCQYDYRTTGVLQYRNNNGTIVNDHTPTSSVNNTTLLNQTQLYANSVWVINNTSVSFYINSELRSTNTLNYTDTDTSTDIYIGKTVGSIGDGALLSNLSCVQIYNRALTSAEIRQNFEAIRGRYGI